MLNWGIIGASGIARVFCNGLQFSETGRLAAVASRTPGKADTLADLFDCQTRYHSYEDLLADDTIDVVYVSNIHLGHAEAVIMAAKAGKHILVEKPIAMNAGEAAEMIEAARANDVFLMEAFMYRCHPQIARMVELIQSGAVGEVLMVRSTFGFYTPFDAHSRVRDKALGGGGILEVGCYPASISRLIAGAAVDRPFLDPIEVKASGVLSATGVDLYTAGTLKFRERHRGGDRCGRRLQHFRQCGYLRLRQYPFRSESLAALDPKPHREAGVTARYEVPLVVSEPCRNRANPPPPKSKSRQTAISSATRPTWSASISRLGRLQPCRGTIRWGT